MNKNIQKKTKQIILCVAFLLIIVLFSFCFCGCTLSDIYERDSESSSTESSSTSSVTKIEKTSTEGLVDTYTITYSDGTSSTFSVTNGKNGEDGENATNITIDDLFEKYKEEYGNDKTYADFLASLNVQTDNSLVINNCVQSCLKIHTEFVVGYRSMWSRSVYYQTSISSGSGVIYKMEDDGYTYVLTNYHVVYGSNVNTKNGTNIASRIVGYMYGSEGAYAQSGTDENSYPVYNYGENALDFEYVGGSVDYDIALLKIETSKIKAINENARAVTLADDYYIGETAIAIGNPENEGISVTQGIVSVKDEYIALAIGGQTRQYRSIRIDTSIYGGSSGGGLFNKNGELIGITNAASTTDENINFAIPADIVKNVAENLLSSYDGATAEIKKVNLGATFVGENSKYVYDKTTGYGKIVEDILIEEIAEDGILDQLELEKDDKLISITIKAENGESTISTTYNLSRSFEIDNLMLCVKEGQKISFTYSRDGQSQTTSEHTVVADDFE